MRLDGIVLKNGGKINDLDRRVSVAPMMDWTDRHCRFFLRLFSPRTLLYTEMITAAALRHGDRQRLLDFDAAEHPVALQLGGSEPDALAQAARWGVEAGYDEINLNVGCPSERVQSGAFGACLMRDPDLVAESVQAMRAAVVVPVTVKTRIGIEAGEGVSRALTYDETDYELLHRFVTQIAGAGCDVFMIHARKAVLKGFSPKDNREVPPLRYDIVRRLKHNFPQLTIIANGGIRTVEQARALLQDLDGVMIGREAYHNPFLLGELESLYDPEPSWKMPTRLEALEQLIPYAERQLRAGHTLHAITRHVLGLFSGQPGARSWRRYFSDCVRQPGAGIEVLERAHEILREQRVA